jgi:hypothetical protein
MNFKKLAKDATAQVEKYYHWAATIENTRWRRVARLGPPGLIALMIIVGTFSEEPTFYKDQEREPEGVSEAEAFSVKEDQAVSNTLEKPSVDKEVDSVPTYPITVVKTGLDFQNTFQGKLKVYPEKTVVEAYWYPECGESSVSTQTRTFTFVLPNDSTTASINDEWNPDCFGGQGERDTSNPYQIDPDGVIRIDSVEPSDGSIIVKDAVVITGGPTN